MSELSKMSTKQMQLPGLTLGTAMWGWTISRDTAFDLLDEWYEEGFRSVDAATNYPIDKNPGHFRLSESILRDWINANKVADLEIIMKVGGVNNLMSPEHLLTKSYLLMMLDEYEWLFGSNLHTFMLHWDNRNDSKAVRSTMEGLHEARERGLFLGLSGIKFPELYEFHNKEFCFQFRIQVKHNVLQSDYYRYRGFHGNHRFLAYGISAGGIKLDATYKAGSTLVARGKDPSSAIIPPYLKAVIEKANLIKERPAVTEFYQLGLIIACFQRDMESVIVGPSSVDQLKFTLSFYNDLKNFSYSDVFEEISLKQTI
jgi:aryl-alcohol dehydrogenase-like predicted oxidoreductase